MGIGFVYTTHFSQAFFSGKERVARLVKSLLTEC